MLRAFATSLKFALAKTPQTSNTIEKTNDDVYITIRREKQSQNGDERKESH